MIKNDEVDTFITLGEACNQVLDDLRKKMKARFECKKTQINDDVDFDDALGF